MKNIIAILIFTVASITLFGQNRSIVSIISQTGDYINLIEVKYEQQIENIEYDAIKNEREIYRELFANVQYGIIVLGDENLTDVNLAISQIIGDEWKVVASDDKTQGMVMLYFTPKETDLYKLNITATLFDEKTFGFYSIIIFR